MMMKALKSRTVLFGILVMALGVLQNYVDFLPVEPQYRALIGIILGAIIILLRFKTNCAVYDK
jgi:hypothetical protein